MRCARGIVFAVGLVSLVALGFTNAAAQPAAGGPQWLPLAAQAPETPLRVTSQGGGLRVGEQLAVEVPGVQREVLRATDSKWYDHLRVPGCGLTATNIGEPELPVKCILLEVPYGVGVSVGLKGGVPKLLGSGFNVYPKQPPQPDGADKAPAFEINAEAYATDALFPTEPVVVGEPGFIRGRRVVLVKIFPLQYNPSSTELWAFQNLSIKVTFTGKPDPKGELRKKRLATPASEAMAEALLFNYRPVAPVFSPGAEGVEPDISTEDAADYLIITADIFYDEALPLAEWKHRKGFITRIATMSEVGSSASDVKNYIQNAYDTWTPAPSYVLLVGDSPDVPPDYYSGSYPCTSDQPYSCVDGTDFFPDLTIGRLPVHTEADCTNVIDKILVYECTPDMGDWYDDFLSAGYLQDYNDSNNIADRWFMETSATVYDFLVNVQGWTGHTAWCTDAPGPAPYHFRSDSYPHRADLNLLRWGVYPYPDPIPSWIVSLWTSASQATADVTAAINAGVSLVQHRDHGGETLWGEPPYGISNINSLTNGVKTPVVFSTNCLTGSFHYTGGDCFCEAFIKKYPGGCVGIVGATRTSYSGYNDLMVHGQYTSFFPSYDTSYTDMTYPNSMRPCEALTYGKYYMGFYEGFDSLSAGEFYMFHWFGDPEMALRTETPQALSVSHPSAVVSGVPVDISVTVTKGGAPLEDALVALSHPTVAEHWTGLTDASGAFTFSAITLTQSGDDYDLVVSEDNCVPYEGVVHADLSSDGFVTLDKGVYSCADTVGIEVGDLDLQGNGTQDVTLTTTGGDSETVTLIETGSGTGLFENSISTSGDAVSVEDSVLQVADTETITATYYDVDTGSGSPATKEVTALVDCGAPVFAGLESATAGAGCVDLAWSAAGDPSTPITYNIYRDQTPGGSIGTLIDSTMDLMYTDTDVVSNQTYYYVVRAQDAVGHEDTNTVEHSATTPPIGSLTTLFAADNGYAGNVFDVEANVPLTITQFDVNLIPTCSQRELMVQYGHGGGKPWPNQRN